MNMSPVTPFNNSIIGQYFSGTGTRRPGMAGLGDTSTIDFSTGNTTTVLSTGETIVYDANGNIISDLLPASSVAASTNSITAIPASSGAAISTASSLIPLVQAGLQIEAAQNLITQQNMTAQQLIAYNAARAQQGLGPVGTIGGTTMSPMMLLLIVGAAFLLLGR